MKDIGAYFASQQQSDVVKGWLCRDLGGVAAVHAFGLAAGLARLSHRSDGSSRTLVKVKLMEENEEAVLIASAAQGFTHHGIRLVFLRQASAYVCNFITVSRW